MADYPPPPAGGFSREAPFLYLPPKAADYDQVSLPTYLDSEVDAIRSDLGDIKSALKKPAPLFDDISIPPSYLELGMDELKSDMKDIRRILEDGDESTKRSLVNLIKIQQRSIQYAEDEWKEFFLPIMRTLERNIKRRIFSVIQDKINCEQQLGKEEDVKSDFDLDEEMEKLLENLGELMGLNAVGNRKTSVREFIKYYTTNSYKPPELTVVQEALGQLANLKEELQQILSSLEYRESPICLYYDLAKVESSSYGVYGYIQFYLITTKRVISIVPLTGAPGTKPIQVDTGSLHKSEIWLSISKELGIRNSSGIFSPATYTPFLKNIELQEKFVRLSNKHIKELEVKPIAMEDFLEIEKVYHDHQKFTDLAYSHKNPAAKLLQTLSYYAFNDTTQTNIQPSPIVYSRSQNGYRPESTIGTIKFTSYTMYRFDVPLSASQRLLMKHVSDAKNSVSLKEIQERNGSSWRNITPNLLFSGFLANRREFKAIIASIPGTLYAPYEKGWVEKRTDEGVMYLNMDTGEVSAIPPYLADPEKFPK